MKFGCILAFVLFNTHFAWAKLGEDSSTVFAEIQDLNGKTISDSTPIPGCYSLKQIDSDVAHVKAYINASTNVVFMVRANSRIFLNPKSLLTTSQYTEFKAAAKDATLSKHSSRRHQKSIRLETTDLKAEVIKTGTLHRLQLIQKSAIPSCASKPEALS